MRHERVIVERRHGHWSAWFADAPASAYGGEWPAEAIETLVAAHPERGIVAGELEPIEEKVTNDHLEFVAQVRAAAIAPS